MEERKAELLGEDATTDVLDGTNLTENEKTVLRAGGTVTRPKILEFPKDVAFGADIIGKRYEYEGKPGRIKVDGVEVAIETLTEAERIDAGEQILKRVSLATNTPVSELRKHLDELAAKVAPHAPAKGPTMKNLAKPVLRMVKTSGGLRPMLVHETAANRKDRRIARAKARQPKRLR